MKRMVVLGGFMICLAAPSSAAPPSETSRDRISNASQATPPPDFFLALGAQAKGYHVNTKMPAGYVPKTLCPATWPDKRRLTVKRWARVSNTRRDCRALQRSYVTSLVRDEKERGLPVVQELWLWIYDTAESASRALENMDDMTFGKRPYEGWRRENMLVILEKRWRFRRAGEALAQDVATRLLETDGWKPFRPLSK